MVLREHERAILHEKLQLLRSITNSHALHKTSIIVDASMYIKELKEKVERLNQDVASNNHHLPKTSCNDQNELPAVVSVETLEKGFLISVFSGKTCPGLLVSVLQVFEDLGLNVLEASVSCADRFRLQAIGGDNEEGESMDAEAVKQAVTMSIKNWSETNEHD